MSPGLSKDPGVDRGYAKHRQDPCNALVAEVAKLAKGFHYARRDLEPDRCFVVYAGEERYWQQEGIEAISLPDLAAELASLE